MVDRSYTEEVKHFGDVVENLIKEITGLRVDLRNDIKNLSDKVSSLQQDTDNLTEGNHRHGIRSVRDEIELIRSKDIKPLSVRMAEIEADVLKYKIKAAGYGTSGGVGIYAIIELIKLVQ